MKIKSDITNESLSANDTDIVKWGPTYATGIPSIDNQHKELVDLTNKLYHACLNRKEDMDTTFKTAMSRLVEYVRYHFSDEQTLLKRIKFPNYMEHKKEHNDLIKEILEAAKKYNAGISIVPNQFVRTLKDWIFSHIAVLDRIYADFVLDQRARGLLGDLFTPNTKGNPPKNKPS